MSDETKAGMNVRAGATRDQGFPVYPDYATEENRERWNSGRIWTLPADIDIYLLAAPEDTNHFLAWDRSAELIAEVMHHTLQEPKVQVHCSALGFICREAAKQGYDVLVMGDASAGEESGT